MTEIKRKTSPTLALNIYIYIKQQANKRRKKKKKRKKKHEYIWVDAGDHSPTSLAGKIGLSVNITLILHKINEVICTLVWCNKGQDTK